VGRQGRPEVAGNGGGAVQLGRGQSKGMIGGAHLSVGHREG
jgi:hypothetical protein